MVSVRALFNRVLAFVKIEGGPSELGKNIHSKPSPKINQWLICKNQSPSNTILLKHFLKHLICINQITTTLCKHINQWTPNSQIRLKIPIFNHRPKNRFPNWHILHIRTCLNHCRRVILIRLKPILKHINKSKDHRVVRSN